MNYVITVVLLLLFLTQSGIADVPIIPVIDIMGFPFLIAISSFGLALLAVILIEAFVLERRERLGYIKSLKLSALANGFSTLIGGGIVITFSSGLLSYFGLIIGSFLFMFLFKPFTQHIKYFKKFGERKELCFFSFLGLGIIASILGMLSMPLNSSSLNYFHEVMKSTSGAYKIFVSIPAALGLYIIGFILTVISEGFIISRYFPEKETKSFYTVLIMNIVSYIVLLIYFLPLLVVRML